MSELVNRRVAQTRAEIVEAAMVLFTANGFDATSMDQIANAAGVSRRTIYRYFATKDDLVFESPRQWLEVFNTVLDTRSESESTRDLYRRALLEVAHFIEGDATRVLTAYAVLTASPALVARHGRSDAEWSARCLELIGPDIAGEPDGLLLGYTASMVLVAAGNALIAAWAAGQPDSDLVQMTHKVLDRVDSIWPPKSR